MSEILKNKVAVVTGGTSGIGRGTAVAFAREGAKVAVGGRREREGKAVVEEIRRLGGEALFLATDVTQASQVQALIDRAVSEWGRLDVAFNNAGTEGAALVPLVEESAENLRQVLDVNVVGVWNSMKAELPHMTSRGGSIINTSSVAGHRGFGTFSSYAASKFAVEGLTRSVAQEVAPLKIRVNTVAPGPIDTEMMQRATGGDPSALLQRVPMGRVGSVSEVAESVVYLASDAASYVTGQALMVDGGMVA